MKTLVSNDVLSRMALCVCVLSAVPIARATEPIAIAMTAERWQTRENAEFLRQLGFYHGLLRLNSGNATLKDLTFGDGTIEFDVNTIGGARPASPSVSRTTPISNSCTSGLIRTVRLSGPAYSMRRRLMVSCYGTSFRNIRPGAASGERVEPHPDGRIRPANECLCERCGVAHLGGR